jgi:hypothetical protein
MHGSMQGREGVRNNYGGRDPERPSLNLEAYGTLGTRRCEKRFSPVMRTDTA